jgi:hypothetical protein
MSLKPLGIVENLEPAIGWSVRGNFFHRSFARPPGTHPEHFHKLTPEQIMDISNEADVEVD